MFSRQSGLTAPIAYANGMGAGCDPAGDLAQVGLHGMGVGPGHDKRGAGAARGADGAKEIEALIAASTAE